MEDGVSHNSQYRGVVSVTKEGSLMLGDCLKIMQKLPDDHVDLICGSPPYEKQRDYLEDGKDLCIARSTEEWVSWLVQVVKECVRICKGITALVVGPGVGGRNWSGGPALLIADLVRSGICLRSPVWYRRISSVGAGGKDWLRPDIEWIICATKDDKELPWSDNTACGHPPKYGRGGSMSRRKKSGERIDGRPVEMRKFQKANPGNVIDVGACGGGHLGSHLAHDNEAPFPVQVPLFFVKSFCPPGGIVLDPFVGSGTTLDAAIQTGRKFVGIDLRMSQIELCQKRIKSARQRIGFGI